MIKSYFVVKSPAGSTDTVNLPQRFASKVGADRDARKRKKLDFSSEYWTDSEWVQALPTIDSLAMTT